MRRRRRRRGGEEGEGGGGGEEGEEEGRNPFFLLIKFHSKKYFKYLIRSIPNITSQINKTAWKLS